MDSETNRLLIVDDDDVYREMIRRHLRTSEIKCLIDEADSVREALAQIGSNTYDCVILDHLLSDGDAFTILQDLHLDANAPPVVMLTQMRDSAVAVRAMKLGVHDFLTKKSVTPEALGTAVIRATKTSRLEREAREQREALERMSFYDGVTSLPNRNLFFDRLGQVLRTGERSGRRFTILMMDLDLFKSVNDDYGHDAGDQVLREVGRRIEQAVREADTVARLGGDEFAAILEGTDSIEGAIVVAEKIVTAVRAPILIEDSAVHVGVSIGIALYPGHGDDDGQLLKGADLAMYAAKNSAVDYTIYEPSKHGVENRATRIATGLRESVAPENLVLHYQPKVSLATCEVVGAEALVRWRHPELGLLPPMDFIPAAERTDAIYNLSWAIIDIALNQQLQWTQLGYEIPLSVNLSARMLDNRDLPETLAVMARERGVSLSTITLEITETATLNNPQRAREVLSALADLGAKISIDDFGTGFTSFEYLRDFPVDEIKIDRLFVSDLATGTRDNAIVKSIVELARGFGICATAEGIETMAVWHQLLACGCEAGQGYFIARPMAAIEFTQWLTQWEPHSAGPFAAGASAMR